MSVSVALLLAGSGSVTALEIVAVLTRVPAAAGQIVQVAV